MAIGLVYEMNGHHGIVGSANLGPFETHKQKQAPQNIGELNR
jgi:hypothetical protein